MKIKRTVKINSYGVGGCSLTVTFFGIAYRQSGVIDAPSPRITTDWSSMGGSNKELQLTSRYLQSPKEAADWIEKVTEEVKQVVALDKQTMHEFEALEGESLI